MNFTTQPTTTASKTKYDRFRPYHDSSGRHSREKPLLWSNQTGLGAKYWSVRLWVKLKKLTQLSHSQSNVSDIVTLLWNYSLCTYDQFKQKFIPAITNKVDMFAPYQLRMADIGCLGCCCCWFSGYVHYLLLIVQKFSILLIIVKKKITKCFKN